VDARLADRLIAWYDVHRRELPWREPGFPAWGTLVSEFMLQQTPVARVLPRLAEWLERWPAPADLAAAAPGEAVRAWANLGYPRRALWLHEAAVQIRDRHGGVVPAELTELLALRGVGAYTARAVAVFAYGRREPVVDTNIRRVIARVVEGEPDAGPPREARDLAGMAALLPQEPERAARFTAAIMEFGALACTARAPACPECPLRSMCAWQLSGGVVRPTGKPRQARYEGSDRQARGAVLRALREAHGPLPVDALARAWPERLQFDRAVLGLLDDGLIVPAGAEGTAYALP